MFKLIHIVKISTIAELTMPIDGIVNMNMS